MNDTSQESRTLVGLATEIALTDTQIAVGDKVGKYEIRAQLGSGGMGAVYLAFDSLIEREVALKVLSPNLGSSPTALQRFLGEARAVGRLNHANIVSIYDIDLWSGQYYLVMELLSGGSVAERVDQSGPLPWKEACRIVAEAARGVAAAHAADMIHRDIKPENLMLTKDGTVKVVDFGLSKLLNSAHDPRTAVTKAGQILGTPQYMSPEQFESADVDLRTDVYSLGATLFRLLTARFPYHDCQSIVQIMTSHMMKAPPVPTEFDASLPLACNRIVAKAMAKSPSERYPSALELAADLEELLKTAESAAPSPSGGFSLDDRPLRTCRIIEPSRMQGAMLRDAFLRAGVQAAGVYGNANDARQEISRGVPDVLITALELPDGRGIDLLGDLCRQSLLGQTTVVLNSSDSTIEDLIASGTAAALVLAPKKVRPEEILRVVHATGPSILPGGPLAAPIDPAGMRLRIDLDFGRIPDPLVEMIRDLKLFDVEVSTAFEPHVPEAVAPNLAMVLRHEHSQANPAQWAVIAAGAATSGALVAAVQIHHGQLILRAVSRNGVTAVCDRTLDVKRLLCLLQASRS